MKGCLVALGVLLGLPLLVVGYIWLSFYSVHVRYRVTVEVQDGDQIKSGSSVLEALYPIAPGFLDSMPADVFIRLYGYAPTVDLGEKGQLILTFGDSGRRLAVNERSKLVFCVLTEIGCLPFVAYGKPGTGVASRPYSLLKTKLTELLHESGPRDVPFILLPKIVRLLDVNGEHKLVPVLPEEFAASFGPGVQLKRVILELTDDPITPLPQIWPQMSREERQNSDLTSISP